MAPSKKPRRRLRARYKVLFVAIALVLAAFTFLLYMSPANKTVPDVSGKTIAEARAVIEGQDLKSVKRKKSTVIRLRKAMSFEPIQMQELRKRKTARLIWLSRKGQALVCGTILVGLEKMRKTI